jgi:eukaryotic-like serine/threonine-protein kinase
VGSAREGNGSSGKPAATAPAAGLAADKASTVLQRRPAAGPAVEPEAATGVDEGLPRALTVTATHDGSTPAPVRALARTPSTPIQVDTLRFASAEDALLDDEVRRSRLLSRFGSFMYAAALLAVPLFPSAPPMTVVGPVSLALGFAASLWLRYLAHPSRYRPAPVTAMWTVNSIALAGGVAYVGVFSPAAVAIAISIYFLGLGMSLGRAFIAYLVAAGTQAVVAALVISGAIGDPGFLQLAIVDPRVLAVCEILLQLILAASFITARASRRATLSAVRNYEEVARALGQRDALLQEARADLERALQLGGIGRFSGQQLGSYRLGAIIGRGGMGEVYDAVHVVSGLPAAVKLLQPQGLASPSAVLRFLREAQLASSLSVPQIVRVFEVGDASASVPYLAMERLRGSDLAELLRSRRHLSPDEVIDLIDQVGRGVDAATAAGVVHRDLKPQNLFLANDPPPRGWRILDFGLSKMIGEGSELTQNRVIGTPIYMAPEQAQGHTVDHRADLYSLAAVAYRCLTGTPPVGNDSFAAVVHAVIHLMPVRPGALLELPADIDSALQIGLAKAPADRYASGAELAEALRDAARGHLPSPLRDRAARLAATHPWRVRW